MTAKVAAAVTPWPYVAADTRLGNNCAMRVGYPTRSGQPDETLTVDAEATVCTAAGAAARLAG